MNNKVVNLQNVTRYRHKSGSVTISVILECVRRVRTLSPARARARAGAERVQLRYTARANLSEVTAPARGRTIRPAPPRCASRGRSALYNSAQLV